MTLLSVLLTIKVLVTLVTIALPFIVLPKSTLDRIAGFGQPDTAFYRLYGTAVLALIVAYSGGIYQISMGIYPGAVIAMGLVSNAGATIILIATGRVAKSLLFTLFFGAIAIGFAVAAAAPDLAMSPFGV
ncbi:MAG: hypothetical protein AAFV29_05930 [Myxococcota bacterium]